MDDQDEGDEKESDGDVSDSKEAEVADSEADDSAGDEEEDEGEEDDAAGAGGGPPPIEEADPPVEPSPAFIHRVVPIEPPFELVMRGSATEAGAGAGMRGGAPDVDALGEAVS